VRTLVTGGAGFIGSHLADSLLRGGHEVTVLDDLSRGHSAHVPQGARFERGDINGDLGELLGAVRPEVVFHLAAQIDVRRSVSEPLLDTRINVLGLVNLFDACAHAEVRRVVLASSGGAIYGDAETIPTPEQHPLRPASHYGAAKAAGELYGSVYQQLGGFQFVALRYANVYGPRQDPHGEAGVVAIFADRLLRGELPTINGDGSQTRDYVYVGDVVDATLAAIEAPPGSYNVGTGLEVDVNALYRRLAGIIGVSRPAPHGPPKAGEQRRSCLDPRLAAERLGWRSRVPLQEGLETTVAYFRDRLTPLPPANEEAAPPS
jgi:UDP-glucose 4-epimerase